MMFDRFKKKALPHMTTSSAAPAVANAVAEWAGSHGLAYSALSDETGSPDGFAITGKVGSKVWKLERGRSSRDYIHGPELRARAELKLNSEVSVLIINRPLKDALEKRAYEMFTDTLQTTADPNLPEEMRWLAMYPQAEWNGLTPEFWKRYAVLAEKEAHASAWVDSELAKLLVSWPEPGPNGQIPFILMVLRGRVYLRMQYSPADMPTLEHAVKIFTHACHAGVSGLSADILV